MSRAGQYRHRVDIQDWLEVRDEETGGFEEQWVTTFANVPARIVPASGREFLAAAAIQSEIVARIVIRARPGLKAKQRVLHKGLGGELLATYNVHAWLPDPESGRDYVSAPVSTGVNEG
jgi:SPP1 family predicted phage head-tail adaptor